jgi:hypothetical protein
VGREVLGLGSGVEEVSYGVVFATWTVAFRPSFFFHPDDSGVRSSAVNPQAHELGARSEAPDLDAAAESVCEAGAKAAADLG